MKRSRRNNRPRRAKRPGCRQRRHGRRERTSRSPRKNAEASKLVGELKLHRDGYGFVIADKPGVEDVFVPARFIGDALHTDIVEVRVFEGRGDKLEGRIVNVVERRVSKLVGRLENVGKGFRVVALDSRVRRHVKVHPKALHGAEHGDEVVVVIKEYPEGDRPMSGEIEKVLEGRGQLDAEEEVIITHHQLPTHFSNEAVKEANGIANGDPFADKENRKDLTDISFITIDGESAQDFDDAVAVQRIEGGLIRLWVSIADVSHYVKPGSDIDAEAFKRGTSVYFPQKCLPMLPEVLSNDLCSLRPDCERFAVTAQLDIDPNGNFVNLDFYRSVIRSRRRMTYAEIKKILVENDKAVRDAHDELLEGIHLMEECFGRLRKKRLERGSLDFDLPEPEIVMDIEGGIETIVKADRHVGHMMIEEFMIAANEAVAELLTECGAGCIYRVHEPPSSDKLHEFAMFIHNLGINFRLGERVPPKKLARVIEKVHGSPEERLVNHKLLRSMSQAVYSPENLGHYGLASTCYCHFTSPIRRYPDLVVHRLINQVIEQGFDSSTVRQFVSKKPCRRAIRHKSRRTHRDNVLQTDEPTSRRTDVRALGHVAEQCSRRERIAMEAEREMAKLYVALFLRDKIGESFDGVVAHVGKFGFFVELIDYFVEGVVNVSSLEDDFYRFDEHGMRLIGRKNKKVIKIGDSVRVSLEEVNVPQREVTFALLEHNI